MLRELIDKLEKNRGLSLEEYAGLAGGFDEELSNYAAEKARRVRESYYGNSVYIRGLIEISSYCKNNCLYCGIRRDNRECVRYRLDKSRILECCSKGYALGFRTFVMQGGEDGFYTDEILCDIIREIKRRWPDCAVTLSLGERTGNSYKALFDAGADRYLLRHETADKPHYEKLHPPEMSFENRMRCLEELRWTGYQVGCGFMVGSPYQTPETIAKDLKFIESFKPEMCGIGPFVPHHMTPFKNEPGGTLELTLFLLSLIRLIIPNVLLPATTALGTINEKGRELGMLAGANVVMPNLSPKEERGKYELYDNKLCSGSEAAENLKDLRERMKSIGFEVKTDRGDVKPIRKQ